MLFNLNIPCFGFDALQRKIKIKIFQLILLTRILEWCSNHNLTGINHNLRKINKLLNKCFLLHANQSCKNESIWHIAGSYVLSNLKISCQIRKVIVDVSDYSFSLFYVMGSICNVKVRFSCVKCKIVSSPSRTENMYLFENFLQISCLFSVEYSSALIFSYSKCRMH